MVHVSSPPFRPASAIHPSLTLFIWLPKYPSLSDLHVFHTISQKLLHPHPCHGTYPFPSSQQDYKTNASTILAPTPSHFPHSSYQLTTCSCLFILPLEYSSPGLVGSRWNSSYLLSLPFIWGFLSPSTCARPCPSPKTSETLFFLQPLLLFVKFQTSSS